MSDVAMVRDRFGCSEVDTTSLTNRARAALEAKGLSDVTVHTHGWGDIRLAGPVFERDAFLAAVEAWPIVTTRITSPSQ